MFLKSLEVFGFKSFADRTKIEFADGITALLGPNGCGKSNVVDAIKWVLGEQATKSLRAEAMEDVIFNGTETRKALSVAEVTLTVVNENGILPLDMPEITIKRRLYRTGDSEYYVNHAPVKLKELRELFWDTGVGKSAYSIMEQGKIDQVLSNKPEERRNLFEEAASITKFKMKGAEAERKLEKTDENMRQVDGILGEVKRSYDSLKKQAEKTGNYRKLKDKSFDLELNIQLIRLRESIEIREKKKKSLDTLAQQRDELKASIDGINEHLETDLSQVNLMESKLIESQKSLYGIELEKNNQDNQIKLLAERIQELQDKILNDQGREAGFKKKLELLQEETKLGTESLADFAKRLLESDDNIRTFALNVETAQKRIQANDEENARLERAILDFDDQVMAADDELRGLTDAIVRQLDSSLGESGYDTEARAFAEQAVYQRLDALDIALDGRIQFTDDLIRLKDAVKMGQGISALQDGLRDLQHQLGGLRAGVASWHDAQALFLDEFLAPEGTMTKKRDLDIKIASVRQAITIARSRIAEIKAENLSLVLKIEEYRVTLEDLRLGKERLKGQTRSVEEQLARTAQQRQEITDQVQELQKHLAEDQGRIHGIKLKIEEISGNKSLLGKQESALQKELATLEKSINSCNKDLASKEKQLKGHLVKLSEMQERIERNQIDFTEAQSEIKNLYANFRERYSRDLSEYEGQMYEVAGNIKDLRDQSAGLREEIKSLGSVNLMAMEEFAEIKERYDFLHGQLEDLRQAKTNLMQVTAEIRAESAQLFVDTYEKIRRNFHNMFRRLFGGGRAELKLTDPDNVLESGIEILAQPPGKKLENIALLSGGERSLTAVGLLFATYMVKPSPFCLLDEIDAALDESNVGRFVTMLMEFGNSSQFIVITHNKKTVTGAKTLLGVTMEESGISKIIAIRLSHEAPDDKETAPSGMKRGVDGESLEWEAEDGQED